MKARLFIMAQHLLPQHALSRLVGGIAKCRTRWIKNRLIAWFIAHYDVDLQAALLEGVEDYENFSAFFTRALKPGARPQLVEYGQVSSPADGTVSQIGEIRNGRLLQAKGHDFSLLELIGGDHACAANFQGGKFVTIYLSPSDYHRVHMPLPGKLRKMIHVPGQLFSVNPVTVSKVNRLFARNERVICLFDTVYGPMAVILVGAMIVASVNTVWAGLLTSPDSTVATYCYNSGPQDVQLTQGAEMASFEMGSTVIVLFGPGTVDWLDSVKTGCNLRVGQQLAAPSGH